MEASIIGDPINDSTMKWRLSLVPQELSLALDIWHGLAIQQKMYGFIGACGDFFRPFRTKNSDSGSRREEMFLESAAQ